MTYSYDEKPSLEDLAHHGVKGMHWGVRKARTGNIDKETARLDRVAGGGGSVRDKALALNRAKLTKVVRKGGLRSEAARNSADLKAQRARLVAGKATMGDLLKAYGSVSLIDIARSTRD
jgi:hypothetical protein